jgi:hypothetical protein
MLTCDQAPGHLAKKDYNMLQTGKVQAVLDPLGRGEERRGQHKAGQKQLQDLLPPQGNHGTIMPPSTPPAYVKGGGRPSRGELMQRYTLHRIGTTLFKACCTNSYKYPYYNPLLSSIL